MGRIGLKEAVCALALLSGAVARAGDDIGPTIAPAAAKKAAATLDRLSIPKESLGRPRIMVTVVPNGITGTLIASSVAEAARDEATIEAACYRATGVWPLVRNGADGGVAALRFTAIYSRPFQMRFTSRDDIGAFLRTLDKSHVSPVGALGVPDGITADGLPNRSTRDGHNRWYEISALRSTVITTDCRVSTIAVLQVAGIFALGIVVQLTLIGLMLRALFAKGVPRNQRRESAYRFMVAATFLAIVGSVGLAPVAVLLRSSLSLATLWGSGPANVMMLSLGWLLGLLAPLLWIGLSGRALGPNPEAVAAIPAAPVDPRIRRARLIGSMIGLLVIIAVYSASEMFSHRDLGVVSAIMIGVVTGFTHTGSLIMKAANNRYKRDALSENSELSGQLAADADRVKLRPKKVRIARGPTGSTQLRVEVEEGAVVVTERALNELTREELRFLLVTKGLVDDSVALSMLILPVMVLSGGLAFLMSRLGPFGVMASPIVIFTSLGLGGLAWYRMVKRDTARRRMAVGLRATLDPKSAASALGKLLGKEPTKSEKRSFDIQYAYLSRAAVDQGLSVADTRAKATNG